MKKDKNICERCGKEAHHTHHRDHNHKNNKSDNLERLCTLCHAKEHGIKPNISELRKLVTYYERVQKAKVTIAASTKSFERIELDPPQELVDEVEKLRKLENKYEKKIKTHWKENPTAVYKWAIEIKGVGDINIAKIASRIDLDKTPSESALWAYAGYAPDSKKKKGKKTSWNPKLKSSCYQLVDCFIKQRTPKYREMYDKEKDKQMLKGITRGHAHNRAIRKVAKLFLRNYYKILKLGESTC